MARPGRRRSRRDRRACRARRQRRARCSSSGPGRGRLASAAAAGARGRRRRAPAAPVAGRAPSRGAGPARRGQQRGDRGGPEPHGGHRDDADARRARAETRACDPDAMMDLILPGLGVDTGHRRARAARGVQRRALPRGPRRRAPRADARGPARRVRRVRRPHAGVRELLARLPGLLPRASRSPSSAPCAPC
ncbi:MAG: hypothetical protein MZV70_15770 [Desulfobacterales bacterium]|nr:hypothetical protein [Desulfobacterales bacterium]